MRESRSECGDFGEVTTFGLGIDIGGTFTDVVLFDGKTSQQFNHKQLTTPTDPTVGVIDGIAHLLRSTGIEPSSITRVVHATTLFTNALIERKGVVTGLITTRGFRDVLEIGRERKYELYDLNIQKPQPLVPRNLRAEADERIAADGSVVRELDEQGLISSAEISLKLASSRWRLSFYTPMPIQITSAARMFCCTTDFRRLQSAARRKWRRRFGSTSVLRRPYATPTSNPWRSVIWDCCPTSCARSASR